MKVKPDMIHLTSLFEAFKNYQTTTGTITVSGSIPTAGADFYLDIPYTREGSMADIYIGVHGSGVKRLANYAWVFTEYVSGDPDVEGTIYVLYTPGNIRVNISIANFKGVPYASPTRVFDVEAVIFVATQVSYPKSYASSEVLG